jgi:hypothetical protein
VLGVCGVHTLNRTWIKEGGCISGKMDPRFKLKELLRVTMEWDVFLKEMRECEVR